MESERKGAIKMTKLNRQIESLESALGMLKDTVKGKSVNLYDLNNDSRYIRQRADEIYYTIQEVLDKAGFDC